MTRKHAKSKLKAMFFIGSNMRTHPDNAMYAILCIGLCIADFSVARWLQKHGL